MARIAKAKLPDVLQTATFELADAVAMQALAQGRADEWQQRRALEWIIYKACGFHDISFRDTDRETSFAEGKRMVAQQINVLLKTDVRKKLSD